MNRIIQYIIYSTFLLQSVRVLGQDTNSVELHFQIYDEGICMPMTVSYHHNSTKNRESKPVFYSNLYVNKFYITVKTKDSMNLNAETNHKYQSSSLTLNSKIDYEIEILRYANLHGAEPEKMNIKISKLKSDIQVIIPFKKGDYFLNDLKYSKKTERNDSPDYTFIDKKSIKNTLKLDSSVYFQNGKKKANFYTYSEDYNLYFIEEFDSINEKKYARGVRLIQLQQANLNWHNQGIWASSDNTKYGYWEYFENDTLTKQELWPLSYKKNLNGILKVN